MSEQTRFQDSCYEYASGSTPSDIITNMDACKSKGSDLWVPETSAEHFFVAQTYSSADGNDYPYHLGILKYDPKQGFYGADNSFHVGSTYYSLNDELKSIVSEQLVIDGSEACLIYNKVSNTWQMKDPCVSAIGVCKSSLGRLSYYIITFEL